MNCEGCRYAYDNDATVCKTCCQNYKDKYQKRPFGDEVRVMSDEELADWIVKHDELTEKNGRLSHEELVNYFKTPQGG